MTAVQRARFAVSIVFLLNGATFATWASRVPAVQARLDLSPGALSVALFGLAVGAFLGLPSAGVLVTRYGSRRVIQLGFLVYCSTLPLLALAPSLALLTVALAFLGAGNSLIDVAMNTQGVEVERELQRPILGSLHALLSLGALIGASLGAGAATIGLSAQLHFLLAGGLFLVFGLLVSLWLFSGAAAAVGPAFAKPTRKLAVLGVIAFCVLLSEGVVNDWSAVYLHEVTKAGTGLAAFGFAAFSLTMAVGRLASDRLVARVGPRVFVRVSAIVAVAGLGLVLLLPQPIPGVVGFALLGAGLAGILPVVFSVAGGRQAAAGSAITSVSTFGYLGFLTGPVAIGAFSELFTLRVALIVVIALLSLTGVLAGSLEPQYARAEDARSRA